MVWRGLLPPEEFFSWRFRTLLEQQRSTGWLAFYELLTITMNTILFSYPISSSFDPLLILYALLTALFVMMKRFEGFSIRFHSMCSRHSGLSLLSHLS